MASSNDIVNGWLVLGHSTKSLRKKTRLGRLPAGSKGLGRLAALRMGKRALLTTVPRKQPNAEHNILIDWDAFDTAKLVDDVELVIETSSSLRDRRPGTTIIIEELEKGFGRMSIKKLARELILLADPFGDDPKGFRPELLVKGYEDLVELVGQRYFREAEYHLRAEVDETGRAIARVKDWKGNEIFQADHNELAKRRLGRGYACPTATFNLWVFILNQQTFSTRRATLGDVRNWLKEFGGVHFYYNGLRVSPYGNPGDDWLELNLRRVRSPEERPSTNTSIGRIDVTDRRSNLVQKTDRSGFIEDDAFDELRAFAQDAMEWMANRRLEEAEKRRAANRTKAPKHRNTARERLDALVAIQSIKMKKQLKKELATYQSQHDKEISLLQKEIQLYRTLSTAGIMAATFAHESSGNPVKVISQATDAIARRTRNLLKEAFETTLRGPIDGIRKALRSLSVLGTATLMLVDHEKRRFSRVDMHKLLIEVLDMYQPFLVGRDVQIEYSLCDGSPYLRGSEAAIESIITNLLNNSLAAFEAGATRNRRIDVSTELTGERWKLRVQDNGPGIEGISKADIWLPGRTTRKNGTGLGLTIVRDAAHDLGGEVSATEKGELGGAVITVELPIIGIR